MFGECHAHIFMNGYDYKKAVRDQQNGPVDSLIREHFAAYRRNGITYVRDGGDPWGVSKRAMALAPEYGITYRTPVFALHREGHYGGIVGRSFSSLREFRSLILELKAQGGHFVKLMTTGILDFDRYGEVTGEKLPGDEVRALVETAHEMGFSVMTHTNGARAVLEAAEAGADSIEHGNFQDEESLACLKEKKTVWVPTLVTVRNLIGNGRFPDDSLRAVWEVQKKTLREGFEKGVYLALGSDAGAYRVLHGQGLLDEYHAFCEVLGESAVLRERLQEGESKIRERF